MPSSNIKAPKQIRNKSNNSWGRSYVERGVALLRYVVSAPAGHELCHGFKSPSGAWKGRIAEQHRYVSKRRSPPKLDNAAHSH
jgi:hypothetical protein